MNNKYYNFNLEKGVIPKYEVCVASRGSGRTYFHELMKERNPDLYPNTDEISYRLVQIYQKRLIESEENRIFNFLRNTRKIVKTDRVPIHEYDIYFCNAETKSMILEAALGSKSAFKIFVFNKLKKGELYKVVDEEIKQRFIDF